MWTINLPLAVQVSSKKWMMLNLNVYRNTHHRELAKAKIEFTERVKPLLKDVPVLERIIIQYNVFSATERLLDVNNIVSVVDKFFADTLVRAGKLPDDNRKFITHTLNGFGGVDRDNPRVEAIIHPIGPNTDIVIVDGLSG